MDAKMMKTTTERQRPPETLVMKLTCDMCGKETKWGDHWANDDATLRHTMSSVTVKKVNTMPDSHFDFITDIVEYDFCPDCFDKLESILGITPQKEVVNFPP
jgi:NMD protein affecting ribosome stability and mRNA decay